MAEPPEMYDAGDDMWRPVRQDDYDYLDTLATCYGLSARIVRFCYHPHKKGKEVLKGLTELLDQLEQWRK